MGDLAVVFLVGINYLGKKGEAVEGAKASKKLLSCVLVQVLFLVLDLSSEYFI